ncbi:uncharacterized protein si:dkey-39a18.1 isoform X2 [Oncorhynchus mykiss]|uniref:uncharacterized protein si:dkey-39a18.1 isoform X2 n=1 Tax=Oncorhynchus mykiss TaxID=8022 RepID=UPI001878CBFE|nr:uncharacterized protein si:dkey-39a18.1 isoform X2 [Oncorhynchus mykiss]
MEGTRGWPSDQQHFLKMMHLPRITKRTQSPHRETVSPVLSYYSEPAYLQHRKDVTRDLAPLPGATRRGALDEEDQEETLSLRSMPSMRSTLSHASKVKRSRGFPKRHTIPELRLPPVTKIHPDPRASLELRGTGYLRCSRLSPIIKSTRTHEPLHQERPPGPAGYRKDKPDRDNMKMQMLVVLAVAALVPSLSEGRILSKCELKNLLEKEALKFNMTGGAGVKNLTNNDFVAKIVCHVEKASGFNTSFVTAWRDDDGPDVLPTRPAKVNDRHRPEPPPRRGKRHAGDDVDPTHPANNDNHPTRPPRPNYPTRLTLPNRPEQPPKRGKRHAGDDVDPTHPANNDNHPTRPPRPNYPTRLTLPTRPEQPPKRGKRHAGNHFTSGEESSSEEETMGTLYGLFQLSDRVICSSGSTPSLNLCQMNCSALIDDNISDDFNCVKTIKQTMESGRGQQTKALKRMINLLFQKECVATVASSYFSKC